MEQDIIGESEKVKVTVKFAKWTVDVGEVAAAPPVWQIWRNFSARFFKISRPLSIFCEKFRGQTKSPWTPTPLISLKIGKSTIISPNRQNISQSDWFSWKYFAAFFRRVPERNRRSASLRTTRNVWRLMNNTDETYIAQSLQSLNDLCTLWSTAFNGVKAVETGSPIVLGPFGDPN